MAEISDTQYADAMRQLKNDAGVKNLLIMVLSKDFTDTLNSLIEESDKGEVELLRGEGRFLKHFIERLGS